MENSTVSFSMMELFKLGGITMWPLLAYSIITLTIGFERIIYYIYQDRKIFDLKIKISEYINNGDYKSAAEFLAPMTKKRMGARILLAMIKRAAPADGKVFSEHQVERAVETESMLCINSLENGLSFLVIIGSLSPLTGFLGTVTGMISAFKSIAEATEVNAQIVANGIYEALITTVVGLVIAISAMIFHSIFNNMADRFASDVEKTCSDLIAEISDRQK